jgi:alkaline phosphatase
MRSFRYSVAVALSAVCLAAFLMLGGGVLQAQSQTGTKNMILFIGDGFGIAPKTATRMALGQGKVGSRFSSDQNFQIMALDKLKYNATITTHSLNSWITDSAPGASVYACGKSGKVDNEMISIDPLNNYTPIQTILEAAKKAGYAVGLVTTTRMTHATPAAFGSHIWNRDLENYIAAQYISASQADYEAIFNASTNATFKYSAARDWVLPTPKVGVEIDVLLGGGSRHFLPQATPGPNNVVRDRSGNPILRTSGSQITLGSASRADGVDLVEIAKQRGYTYVNSRDALLGLDTNQFTPGSNRKLLGLFRNSHSSYEQDRQINFQHEPTLAELTRIAIAVLKRKSTKGFFLMVEGGRIDHMEHANVGGVSFMMDGATERWGIKVDSLAFLDDGSYNGAAAATTAQNVYGSDYLIKEVLSFDYAVEEGRKFMNDRTNGQTLIMSTSDHECGGLAVVGLHDEADLQANGTKIRTYAKTPSQTSAAIPNPQTTVARGDAAIGGWFPEYSLVKFQDFNWPQAPATGRRIVISYGSNPVVNGNSTRVAGGTPGNHTPQDILVHADDNMSGDFAKRLTGRGLLDNTDLNPIMLDFMGVQLTTAVAETRIAPLTTNGAILVSPNPVTNSAVTFSLTVSESSNVMVDVYNALGQRVRRLGTFPYTAGTHTIQWNKQDDFGTEVESGAYFVVMSSEKGRSTEKFVVSMR